MKLIILFIILLFTSCDSKLEEPISLSIVSYNLYGLFDYNHIGKEWHTCSKDQYEDRLNSLIKLLKQEEIASADIIFFQEIENEKVLLDLLDESLVKRGFCYYAITLSNGVIQQAFISKIKPSYVNIHKVEDNREILSLELYKDGKIFTLYTIHAKSKLTPNSNNKRKEISKFLNTIVNENANNIILGDFNSELCYDNSDILSSSFNAIENNSLMTFLDLDNSIPNSYYDPFSDYYYPLSSEGTYYYENSWFILDHIIFNSSIINFISAFKAEILNYDFLLDEFKKPIKYNGETGFSDHFPIRLELWY